MEFINLHVSVLDSQEFKTAEPVDRGTWLCLYRYCAGQENGGTIANAKALTCRNWQQLAGVTLKEVQRASLLWKWDGDSLVLSFYNAAQEATTRRLRSQAAQAAHARWHANSPNGALPQDMPSVMPDAMPDGTAKHKGREVKGREDSPELVGADAAAPEHSTPRKRKAVNGMSTPDEHPEAIRQRLIMLGALKGRRADTPWSAKELAAFREARLDTCDLADFEAQVGTMAGYYHAKIPREMDYRRRDLQTLLNNWPGELDRAREHQRRNDDGVSKA